MKKHNAPNKLLFTVLLLFTEPPPPTGVIATPINSTAVSVKWKRPLKPNGVVQSYTVLYVESSKYLVQLKTPFSVLPNVTTAVLNGLKPFTNYTFHVRIQTNGGTNRSRMAWAKTDPAGNEVSVCS